MPGTVLLIFELIGTVAFAASGAMTGLKKHMDIFGVVILGLTTAVGGGMIRDLILGVTPPAMFQDPIYAVVAVAVAVLMFLPPIRRLFRKKHVLYDHVLLLMDSVGLGIFTVVGVDAAFTAGFGDKFFLSVFVGVLTGVGGGILRDIFAGNTPSIFVKHFYACASIIGAVLCALLWSSAGSLAAMVSGALTVLALRLLAARFRWSLPRA